MASPHALRRLKALTNEDWRLLAEASVALVRASLAVRLLPFRKALVSSSGPVGKADSRFELQRAAWAVRAAARRLPIRAVCFQQGLALQAMLRRRGRDARLHYGVRSGADEGLTAHVWVTDEGRVVLGEDGHERYACLYRCP